MRVLRRPHRQRVPELDRQPVLVDDEHAADVRVAVELDREVADFQSLDIGLYPILEDGWSSGKSGFKAIQYMAVGVPFVISPVGACAGIGTPGETHFEATTPEQWYASLKALLSDRDQRVRMGEMGRRHALEHFSLSSCCATLETTLREVSEDSHSKSGQV